MPSTCLALNRDFFGGDIVGDLGIEWLEENHDRVAETLQKLIDNGVDFYFVEKTSGLVRNKTKVTLVESQGDIKKIVTGRKVYIKNPDIKALIDEGIANVATLTGVPDFTIAQKKKAKTGKEAAAGDTVAMANRGGG